jgi:alpha-tubulin suppressor-like RCC1 family protein
MLLTRRSRPLALALTGAVASTTLLASPGQAAVVLPVRAQATTIATGGTHSVLIAADGSVWGTGLNSSGQLTGTGNHTALARLTGLPAGVRAKAVSAADANTVVLGSDGVAYGTGLNISSSLTGAGARSTLTPLTGLPTGVLATAVSTSGTTTVVLGSDGVAYGAGANLSGQLTGTSTPKSVLTAMPLGVAAVAVAAGEFTTLVLGTNGVVYGTGARVLGRLCSTATTVQTTLLPLTGLPAGVTTTAIAVSSQTTILLGSDGVAYGCGVNASGQLTGTTGGNTAPTALSGLPGGVTAKGVAAGAFDTLVLGSNGVAYGAGYNLKSQITGADTSNKTTLTPLSPAGAIGPITELASSETDSIVRDSDGIVYGTGGNATGELTGTGGRQALTAFAGQPLAAATRPAITGSAKVGSRLTASKGDWSPTPTAFGYQWSRSGTPITGAHGSTYTAQSTDLGKALSVIVIASRAGFVAAAAGSAATKAVARGPMLAWSPKKKPTIKVKGGGRATVGHTLRIKGLKKARWSPDAANFDYRWTRNGKHIKHATKKTYTLKGKDRGKKLRVIISAKRPGYTTGTLTLHKKKVAR